MLAKMLDNFQTKHLRSLCKLVGVKEFGKQYENGSYSHALKMLKEKVRDSLKESLMRGFIQSIFDIESILIWLSVLAFMVALILMLVLVKKRPFCMRVYLVIGSLLETDHRLTRRFSVLALLVLFYNIYFMLFKFLVQTDMRTEIVVLNTSSIVDNAQDLLETDHLIW